MERKLKPHTVQQILWEKSIQLFSPEEFQRLFSVSLRAAQEFIKDHSHDLFLKLKNGIYALRMNLPSEEAIANRLYAPSYISFEYALAHYGLIPESVYMVTSATTRITREFTAANKVFEYSQIKKPAYRGYRAEKRANMTILIAEPEKALADYLYFVDLRLKSINERLNLRRVNKKKVITYAKYFSRESLVLLAKQIL